MLKKILSLLKKVLLSVLFLVSYNLLAAPIGMIIPINIITVALLTLFGIPALLSLVFLFLIVF